MDIFAECHLINDLLLESKEVEARDALIRLLDYHLRNNIAYSEIVNHLIRATGLYPYLQTDSASWQDRFVYEAFKVDVGSDEPVTLHREQSFLLRKLVDGESIAVSAPTSFGKSFVIDAFIKLKSPQNVLIIVPTIALTDETRRRLYKKFAGEYRIITTSEVELGERNIFIFPPERAIQYVSKLESIDLLIVDEFYKASTNFDKDRAPVLIKAILQLGQIAKQKYFLAPNIATLGDNPFTEGMEFFPIKFNTVFLEQHNDFEQIGKDSDKKSNRLLEILNTKSTKTLIYAGTYANIASLSTLLLTNLPVKESTLLSNFAEWLATNYDYNWSLTNLVRRGIGVHNGRLHRSLSQIQIKLFEDHDGLNNIISTSSIVEGVNTSAENVVIWANKNGRVKLDDFTYQNIMGRGGRMFKHFIGKIYVLDSPPAETETQLHIPFPDEILGNLDEVKYQKELTKEQVAKIILYKREMSELLGEEEFTKILNENSFEISDQETIRKIAQDLKEHPDSWNGLDYLNSPDTSKWDNYLYRAIRIAGGSWDAEYLRVVEFTKVLYQNWRSSIPQLLEKLDRYDIGIEEFFKLERTITFKLATLFHDLNILQKAILKHKGFDISRFVGLASHAFLPTAVYQLEEYGIPRMISKKIHDAKLIDFYEADQKIHHVLDAFIRIGLNQLLERVPLTEFEKYIVIYFYDGILPNERSRQQ